MLAAIALIPSAPILVPELAGAALSESVDLRSAVLEAVEALPSRWVAIGAGARETIVDASAAGTFAGYGVDVRVALSPAATGPVTELPLAALITGWARTCAAPECSAQVRVYAEVGERAVHHGVQLRRELADTPEPVGVLVVADGANTLTNWAPGGFVEASVANQERLDDALAAGDAEALIRRADGAVGAAAYGVLAGLVGADPVRARELYRDSSYGVGYFVGLWQL